MIDMKICYFCGKKESYPRQYDIQKRDMGYATHTVDICYDCRDEKGA